MTLYNDTPYNDTPYNDTPYNDTQHNDTLYNDTQHTSTRYTGTQHNDTRYNGTQLNNKNATLCRNGTQHACIAVMPSAASFILMLSVIIPNVVRQNVVMLIVAAASTRGPNI
jgi:hypothetical protein